MQMFIECEPDFSDESSSGLSRKDFDELCREEFLEYLWRDSFGSLSIESRRELLYAAGVAYDKKYARDMLFRERVEIFMYKEKTECGKKAFFDSLMKDIVWDGSLKRAMSDGDGTADR